VHLREAVVDSDARLEVPAGRVRELLTALAAAEAAGTARWALRTAVGYAGVREQFGRKIGSFQAIKHLCAQMLERAESTTAVAWGAACAHDGPEQRVSPPRRGGGGPRHVDNARTASGVGGIGFAWEHDAHLHLRGHSAPGSCLEAASAAW
jgi:alkylation response protein AidB-like acyl-CoA dehydrogenase